MTYQVPADALTDAMSHAQQSMPLESCGLIIGGKYYRVPNTAGEPDFFTMEMKSVLKLELEHGAADAIVHSHVLRPAIASIADLAACEMTGKPWLIVSVPLEKFTIIEPRGYRAPLIGRAWAWGTHDCFGLVRDAMKEMGNIEIPDFDREWMWWENGKDLLGGQFKQAGFIQLPPDTPWKHLDAACCQVRCKVANHCGLYLDGDLFLHQLMNQKSARVPFNGFWRDTTRFHLRHESLMHEAAP